MLFLGSHPGMIPVYEALAGKLLASYPDTKIKVSKSKISFYNRHLYACVSFARVSVKTEPYPGRWTSHIVIPSEEALDEELLGWIDQAYQFVQNK